MIGILIPLLATSPTQLGNEWQQKIRDYQSELNRTPVEQSINSAIDNLELDYGSTDPTEQEELLQLPSDKDRQGTGPVSYTHLTLPTKA